MPKIVSNSKPLQYGEYIRSRAVQNAGCAFGFGSSGFRVYAQKSSGFRAGFRAEVWGRVQGLILQGSGFSPVVRHSSATPYLISTYTRFIISRHNCSFSSNGWSMFPHLPCLLALLHAITMMSVTVATVVPPRQQQQRASTQLLHGASTQRASDHEDMQGRLHASERHAETIASAGEEEGMQGRLHAAALAVELHSVHLRHMRSRMHEGVGSAVMAEVEMLPSQQGAESSSSSSSSSSSTTSSTQLRTMLADDTHSVSPEGPPCVARKKMLWFTSIAGK